MNSFFLFMVMVFSTSNSSEKEAPEDFKVISQLLYELEKRNSLPGDIYQLMPPLLESKEYFIERQDDLTPDEAGIRYDSLKMSYQQQLNQISKRELDSSKIFLATSNYLTGGSCQGCRIVPDTLTSQLSYKRYRELLSYIHTREMVDIEIPFEQLEYYGKYRLKSIDDFPPREEMYNGALSFLSGGEIEFTRFFQRNNLGVIYFSTSYCELDCSAGYLALFEQREGEWTIFDILLQWIT